MRSDGFGMSTEKLWAALLVWWLVSPSQAGLAESLSVEIDGLDGELLDNAREFLDIVRQARSDEVPSAKTIRRLHKRAPEEIAEALQPFGYYRPATAASLDSTNGEWLARYVVEPGPPVVLRDVDVRASGDGSEEPAIQETLSKITLAPREQLDHRRYEAARDLLFGTAFDAGYLDTKYERSEIRVYPEADAADIFLILETGPQYFFGDIAVEQNILRPEFVKKFIEIEPGEPFDSDRLIDLQLTLSNTGYFDQVEVMPDREAAEEDRIPITVLTEPRKPRNYVAGLGFGTDTGPRAMVGIEYPRFNRRGHRFRSDLRVSERKNSLTARYQIPVRQVRTDRATFFGNLERAEVGDADTDRFSVGANLDEDWLGLRRRLYVEAKREDFAFGDDPSRVSNLGILGGSLARVRADDSLIPRKGYSFSVDVHGGAEGVLSDTSFIRSTVEAKKVFPLGGRGKLLLRGQAGLIKVDDFDVLPPSERFFTGGSRSVRGYDFESLSPIDANGNNIGGRQLLVGSIEMDYLIRGPFGAAVFFDIGDADNDFPSDLKRGAGIGFRYESPVGMIRIDFAHPFDDPDRDLRIHLSIGPDL